MQNIPLRQHMNMPQAVSYLLMLILVLVTQFGWAQETVFINEDVDNAAFSVQIKNDITFPDIKVQFGKNIPFEDITVGITNFESRAHFVIKNNASSVSRQVKVANCDNFPDLKIQYGPNLPFPDFRIEFRENGMADYLIYTENILVSEQEVLACLLPLIREKTKK